MIADCLDWISVSRSKQEADLANFKRTFVQINKKIYLKQTSLETKGLPGTYESKLERKMIEHRSRRPPPIPGCALRQLDCQQGREGRRWLVEPWRHREAGGGRVHERWEGENREGRRRLLPAGGVGNGKNKARVYEYI
jgi:hypothetical protein